MLDKDALRASIRDMPMRRWYVSLTVIGLGGIGALLLMEWNDNLDGELDRIQAALDRVAESIDPRPELGQ